MLLMVSYWAETPNAIKQNTGALLRCTNSVYFTDSHFVLGSLLLGYRCNPL